MAAATVTSCGTAEPIEYDSASALVEDMEKGDCACDPYREFSDISGQDNPAVDQSVKESSGVADMAACGDSEPTDATVAIYPQGASSSQQVRNMMSSAAAKETRDAHRVTGPNWDVYVRTADDAKTVASAVEGEITDLVGRRVGPASFPLRS